MNTMKNNTINLVCELPQWGDDSVNAKNLRRSSGGLIPAGIPAVECDIPGGRMIGVVGDYTLFLDGRRVLAVGRGVAEVVGTLPGEYRCHAVAGDKVVFMTASGAWRVSLTASGDWFVEDFGAEYPKIRIGVCGTREFSAVTPSRELSGSYQHWAGPLSETDIKRVSADVISAYSAAVSSGMSAGYYTQPVAVWYRLLDSFGGELYRSEAVVVADGGYRGLDAVWGDVGVDGGVYSSLGSLEVKLRGFTLGYEIGRGGSESAPTAAAAEVYVSPLIDPVDYSGEVTVTFGSHDATSARLGARLPLQSGLEERVRRLLDRLDAVGRRIAVIQNPFDGEISGMTLIDHSDIINPAKEAATLTTALRKSVAERSVLMTDISQPHGFSAGAVGICADITVWGDITPLSALPSGVWVNRAETVAKAWSSVMRVTIDRAGEEETVAIAESGSSDAPISLGPVIGYPHPRATRLQVAVTYGDGTTRGIDVTLTPTADGRSSCYVSPLLVSVPLAEGAAALSPVVVRAGLSYPGAVAAAVSGNQFQAMAVTELSSGRIRAISELPRYGNSLDMGRRHVVLFTTGGIHAAAINPSRGAISCHCIDRGGVETAAATAIGQNEVYAVSNGRLVSVAGGKVSALARGCDFSELCYSGRHGELMCLDKGGRVFARDEQGCWSEREYPQKATGLCGQEGRAWLMGESSVYDLDRETEEDVAISYSVSVCRRNTKPTPISRAIWIFGASSFQGTVSASGSTNGVDEVTTGSFRVEGRINVPPHTPLLFNRYRCLRMSVEGYMSPDGELKEIIME